LKNSTKIQKNLKIHKIKNQDFTLQNNDRNIDLRDNENKMDLQNKNVNNELSNKNVNVIAANKNEKLDLRDNEDKIDFRDKFVNNELSNKNVNIIDSNKNEKLDLRDNENKIDFRDKFVNNELSNKNVNIIASNKNEKLDLRDNENKIDLRNKNVNNELHYENVINTLRNKNNKIDLCKNISKINLQNAFDKPSSEDIIDYYNMRQRFKDDIKEMQQNLDLLFKNGNNNMDTNQNLNLKDDNRNLYLRKNSAKNNKITLKEPYIKGLFLSTSIILFFAIILTLNFLPIADAKASIRNGFIYNPIDSYYIDSTYIHLKLQYTPKDIFKKIDLLQTKIKEFEDTCTQNWPIESGDARDYLADQIKDQIGDFVFFQGRLNGLQLEKFCESVDGTLPQIEDFRQQAHLLILQTRNNLTYSLAGIRNNYQFAESFS